jgi:DNA-binding CsgD family transcriptional regulator
MKKCGEDGIDLYSSGTKSEQLSSVYADDTVSQYLGEGQAEFGLFRKPIQREWHQLELVEYPLVFKEELLGVLGVIFESDKAYKENMFFLNAISVLMVIKLQQMSKEVGMTDAAFSLEEEPLKRSFELFLATREEMAFVQQPLDKCRLTPRETEILNQVLQGLNNLEIAKKLFISTHTVKNHITKIYEKLGVIDRAQAIAKMYRKL